jgi:hypothetical protein
MADQPATAPRTIDTRHLTPVLDGLAIVLDVDPRQQELIVGLYDDLGAWLAEQQEGVAAVRVYPQGSFRLGTVVRPSGAGGQFDIDLVFLRDLSKSTITKAELKAQAGELLRRYCRSRGYAEPVELGRCWRLEFFEEDFHLDILPVIPDAESASDTGILLTDRELTLWQQSNPIGFANWFYTRMNEVQLREGRLALAAKLGRSVEDVPVFMVRTPLQRAVQLLKRHRDLYFKGRDTHGPPSVLITTLAGLAYDGDADVGRALITIARSMRDGIQRRGDLWWVPNPSHPEENFADKWNTDPSRKREFDEWLETVTADLARSAGAPGIETSGNHAAKAFGNEALDVAHGMLGIEPPSGLGAAQRRGELAPGEQSIEHMFTMRLDCSATVTCRILPTSGWNRASRRELKRRRHGKQEELQFRLETTTVPEPYEIYWKIRNFGREAWTAGQLRGQIRRGESVHRESTLYTGEHYADCYLVKDGVCRARTRVWVPVAR